MPGESISKDLGIMIVIKISFIFIVFALIHSLCLREFAKDFVQKILGEAFVKSFYRISYTFLSVITTAVAFALILSLPDQAVFKCPPLLRWLMYLVRFAGVLFGALTFRVLDFREFAGFRQAWRYVLGEIPLGDKEGLTINRLITSGTYGIVRHPLYLAGIVLFTFAPDMTRNWLTVAVLADAYFIYGAVAEEKKLIERFGDEYLHYMQRVPMFVPGLKINKEKPARFL